MYWKETWSDRPPLHTVLTYCTMHHNIGLPTKDGCKLLRVAVCVGLLHSVYFRYSEIDSGLAVVAYMLIPPD